MRRICWPVLVALLLGACADAGLRREVVSLRERVKQLEQERDTHPQGGSLESRLAKVEKFLAPYIDAPPAPPEPDAKLTYAVPVSGDPVDGASDALVTLVFAYDYACPYCYRTGPTLAQLRQKYGADLRVVYKSFVVHPDSATLPALASCAAAQQGKFAEMDHLLWERGFVKGGYTRELVVGLARELALDERAFAAALDGEGCKARIAADAADLAKLGVNGTPASFINGRFIGGAQPVDAFINVIDGELALARERVAAGTPAGEYYQRFVVEKGRDKL